MSRMAPGGILLVAMLLLAQLAYAQGPERDRLVNDREATTDWIGKVVPPYPLGIVEQRGTCIGGGDGSEAAICYHSIDVLFDPQSHLRTVLVVEEVPHFGDATLGRIVDAIEPVELDDPALQVAIGTCQRDGQDDIRLVAIVDPRAGQEWLVDPRRVWRADPATGRLHALAPAGIRCRNEDFGYDG